MTKNNNNNRINETSERSVRFASKLTTVLLIERKDALMIQSMFYDIEDYRRFREEKLLDDLRIKFREEHYRFAENRRAVFSRSKQQEQSTIATSKNHGLRPRQSPQGAAQAA
jgi:phosphorylcholine metabolism protein LicD